MIKNAVYEVPNDSGDYDEIHFRTGADMVKETDTRKFVSFASDLKNTTKSTNAVLNATTLGSILSNCKIVISDKKPAAEAGYNILWINLNAISND